MEAVAKASASMVCCGPAVSASRQFRRPSAPLVQCVAPVHRPARLAATSKRRCRTVVCSYGGSSEPSEGSSPLVDADMETLRRRIGELRERESQLKINIQWFGWEKKIEWGSLQLADSRYSTATAYDVKWAGPMLMGVLTMLPLYVFYLVIAFGYLPGAEGLNQSL